MAVREKLIELLESAESAVYWDSNDKGFIQKIADHLLANGVTFANDNNDGRKWIPVSERLPEDNKKVLVLLARKIEVIAILRNNVWLVSWNHVTLNHITHWMPLPELPQEVK